MTSSSSGLLGAHPPTRTSLLSAWDRAENPLAPLDTAQKDSIVCLQHVAQHRPAQFRVEDSDRVESSRSSSKSLPLPHGGPPDAHAPDIPNPDEIPPDALFPAISFLERPGTRIDTGHQFLEWLHQIEHSLQTQSDAPYRHYIEQLEQQRDNADQLLTRVNQGLSQIELLAQQYHFVSEKSNSLHMACQHLMQEQTKLSALSDQISERLVFFTSVDKISQKLQSPTLSVNSDVFVEQLDLIDECILFNLAHPNFKQSGAYQVKYQACLSRALGLVRSYSKSIFEAATNAAMPPPGTLIKSSQDTAFSLFYGKFRAQAPKLSKPISTIEQRAGRAQGSSTDTLPLWQEYESVLNDCQNTYFQCRGQLLQPSVKSAVLELSQKYRRDHCGLVRAGCAFLLHVCEDEYQLFHQFFNHDSDNLNAFLEGLCQVLYDTLRPLVIHLNHLETLSELTGILRSEMIGHHCAQHPPQLLSFETVISQLLQDVQERLVYRAYIYIRTDILGYVPAGGDLAYPEKLEMMESIAETIQKQSPPAGIQRKNSTSSLMSQSSIEVAQINGKSNASHSPADLHGMWYPPVRRTLVCLSKLYRCLEREIFQGLSQEALAACINSVSNAADLIAAKKTLMDGQLFQIKHLLILREQIAPFHVDFSVREMSLDFSKFKNAAASLFHKRGDILTMSSSNAILEFLLDSTPEVREYCRDSRKDVDKKLKQICEYFIANCTKQVVGKILEFQAKVDTHRSQDKTKNISREPWAKPEILQDVLAQSLRHLKKQFPVIQRAMQLYLSNKETEFILFRPIRNNVMSAFMGFIHLSKQDYTSDEQVIIGCPTQEQIAVTVTSLQLQPKTPRSSVSRQRSESPNGPPNPGANALTKTGGEAVIHENGQNGETEKSIEE